MGELVGSNHRDPEGSKNGIRPHWIAFVRQNTYGLAANDPISALRYEHERCRRGCAKLGSLVDDMWQPGHERMAALLERFVIDATANAEIGEGLLTLVLLRRCAPADDAAGILAIWRERHAETALRAALVLDGLAQLAAGFVPPKPLDFVISTLQFIETLKQQLDWEDNVLLPLASRRLTGADKRMLGSALTRQLGAPHNAAAQEAAPPPS
jgi:hypothetical protein